MSNKECFEMTDEHIKLADPHDRQKWAIALLLRESGSFEQVSVIYRSIDLLLYGENNLKKYICSKELCDWQIDCVHNKKISHITVVLDHKEMTASIF